MVTSAKNDGSVTDDKEQEYREKGQKMILKAIQSALAETWWELPFGLRFQLADTIASGSNAAKHEVANTAWSKQSDANKVQLTLGAVRSLNLARKLNPLLVNELERVRNEHLH